MIPKTLIKFVEKNARQIKKLSKSEQDYAMGNSWTCVLRPNALPHGIVKQMTSKEMSIYENIASLCVTRKSIDTGVNAVKRLVNASGMI